jgi:hypothetical protein
MKKIFLLFVSITALAETAPPKQNFVFSEVKPACTLEDNKLVLSKMWPFGSWEACAYSILQVANQLADQRTALLKEVESLKAPAPKALPLLKK